MKITSLALKSFRSFVDVELSTDVPRVMFVGLNGTGKTSVRTALKWALMGHCEGTDARGGGAEVLVPQGNGNHAEVIIGLNGRKVRRTWGPSGGNLEVDGFSGTGAAQQTALYEMLSEPFLAAALDSSTFLDLNHADAKAFVLALLDVKIAVGETTYTLEQLEAAYQTAFSDRRTAKARLKAHLVPALPLEAKPPLEKIDEQLGKLRTALETEVKQTAGVAGQRTALKQAHDALMGTVSYASQFKEDAIPGLIEELEERLGIVDDAPATPTPAQATVEAGVGTAGRLQVLKSRAEALKRHLPKSGCVLDPDVPCETAQGKFTKAHKAVLGEIETAQATVQQAAPQLEVFDGPLAMVKRRLTELRDAQKGYEATRTENLRRQNERARLEEQAGALPDTTAAEQTIAALRERVGKGETLRRDAQAYWTAVATHEKATGERKALAAEVAKQEALCEALGPSGARVQALQKAMGAFEAAVNVGLKPFGWTVAFALDPWQVIVNGRPVETYSRSEAYRIGVALQLAVADLSGLSFAVVDELDMLDEANRKLMGAILYQSKLEQVFILSTRESTVPLPATIPNLRAYRFGRGEGQRSVVLEVAGAVQGVQP